MKNEKILVVDCGSSKVPAIQHVLEKEGCAYDTVPLLQLENITGYKGIVISGAPILLTEVEHTPYLQKAQILFSKANMPILGICFGHQLMGLHHGAGIQRCPEDRDFQKIVFPVAHPLIAGTPGIVLFHEDHCESIGLPVGFERQASSVTCTNEAMQHEQNPWWGVQFHPETSGQAGHDFIANFIRYCGAI